MKPQGQRALIFGPASYLYALTHSYLLLYKVTILNVAVNSTGNALLSLMVSNQFMEIKSAVFKKYDEEGLLAVTCYDIVKRFEIHVFLVIIAVDNWIELQFGPAIFVTTVKPLLLVYLFEAVIDCLKHAFVIKSSRLSAYVYRRYLTRLQKNLVVETQLPAVPLISTCLFYLLTAGNGML